MNDNQIDIYTPTQLKELKDDISNKYVGCNIVLRGKLIENLMDLKKSKTLYL